MYSSRTLGPATTRYMASVKLRDNTTFSLATPPIPARYGLDTQLELFGRVAIMSDYVLVGSYTATPSLDIAEQCPQAPWGVHKPINFSYDPGTDGRLYGGSVLQILDNLNKAPDHASHIEKQVYHKSFKGDLADAADPTKELYKLAGSFTFPSTNVSCPTYIPAAGVGKGRDVYTWIGFDAWGHKAFKYEPHFSAFHTPVNPTFPLLEYLEAWTARVNLSEAGMQRSGTGYLTVVRHAVNKTHVVGSTVYIDLSYDYEMRRDGHSNHFRVHKRATITLNEVFGARAPFTKYEQPDVFTLVDDSVVEYSHSVNDKGVTVQVPSITTHEPLSLYPYQYIAYDLPTPTATGRTNFHLYRMGGTSQVDGLIDKLSLSFTRYLNACRTSSFFSSCDALYTHSEVLSQNYIEVLSELPELTELLPDIKGLSQLLSRAVKRDPRAIVDAVDLITGAILKYRFGQAPAVDTAKELTQTDIENRVLSLLQTKEATIYGNFHYEFLPEEKFFGGDGRLTLDTRSKVRIRTNFTTFMGSLLVAESIGIMPSLSRLWEVLPFSFVVDWFTGMKNRLHHVDGQARWMCVNTDWCLHSYTCSYYPTQAELSRYGLVSGSDPFRLSVYYRDFSRYMPILRDNGHFDFLRFQGRIDPLIAGSLVWQLL